MTIDQLIQLTSNKLVILNEQKKQATQMGDILKVTELETEIFNTETTLTKLKSVL
jgi:hypothetical protein